jgi:hypothetical protein
MIYKGPGFLAVLNMAPLSPHLPSPVSKIESATHRKTEKERWERRAKEWVRSQIIRWRECLVLYKSFNNLWFSR